MTDLDLYPSLLRTAETLKSLLMERATGNDTVDADEYLRLRTSLLSRPEVRQLAPEFVRICRSLPEFWTYIKDQAGRYEERRLYLAAEFDPLMSYLEQHVWDADTMSTPSSEAEVRPAASGEGVIFALMPFAPAFDRVYGTLKQVAEEFDLKGRACLRADEIAEPGRITEQITRAIRGAQVVVADITGNNPNVMFELGYADALGKPIVALNQHVESSPFDLKDLRQIRYDPGDIVGLRGELRVFLRRLLHAE